MGNSKFKNHVAIILLIFCDVVFSKPCMLPKEPVCDHYSGYSTHFYLKIHFEDNEHEQIVYVNGGCTLGIEQLTSKHNSINLNVSNTEWELELTYCKNNKLMDKKVVKIGSDTHMECTLKEGLQCKSDASKTLLKQ